MNSSTRGQHKCPFILGSWQMHTGTCVMSSTSSQLTHTLVYMHGFALRDTHALTHRAPEASIKFALRVQNNLLKISHSNSLQRPLDNCLNTHPAVGCNQNVMRYCLLPWTRVCMPLQAWLCMCVFVYAICITLTASHAWTLCEMYVTGLLVKQPQQEFLVI